MYFGFPGQMLHRSSQNFCDSIVISNIHKGKKALFQHKSWHTCNDNGLHAASACRANSNNKQQTTRTTTKNNNPQKWLNCTILLKQPAQYPQNSTFAQNAHCSGICFRIWSEKNLWNYLCICVQMNFLSINVQRMELKHPKRDFNLYELNGGKNSDCTRLSGLEMEGDREGVRGRQREKPGENPLPFQ